MGFMRMGRLFIVIGLLSVLSFDLNGQTCTVTGTSPLNWVNPGPSCVEGGDAGSASVIIIPAGFTLRIGGADTWTGTRIEVNGSLSVTADVTFNTSIMVKNGGVLNLNAKLFLGTTSGCGYGVGVASGGLVNVGGTGSDRLNVCGVEIMKGNGACNSCGGTNSGTCAYDGNPYCEPAGGFTGPTGYGETGYDATLPIHLVSFTAELHNNNVEIKWITENEENFDHFEVQRAGTDLEFTTISSVEGIGNSGALAEYATTDENPLIGENYYRLKAVDLDGSFEYFNVVAVRFDDGRSFLVSPNPATRSSIKYSINFEPSTYDQVVLIDAVGNELQREKVTQTQSELVPNKNLPPGTYLLRYVSTKYQRAARVLIKD